MAEEKDTIQTQNEITDEPPKTEKPKRTRKPRAKKEPAPVKETVAEEKAQAPAEQNAPEQVETAAPEQAKAAPEAVEELPAEPIAEEAVDALPAEAAEPAREEITEETTVEEVTEEVAVTDEFSHIPTSLSFDEETAADGEDGITAETGEIAPAPEEDDGGFLIVEHFADFYEKKQHTEEADVESDEASEEYTDETDGYGEPMDGEPSVDYENLTILETISEEKPRARARARDKHTTAPDDLPFSTERQRGVDNRFDIIELFVFTLTVILLITTFLFKHSVVQGTSMVDTLHDGDHLIISDFLYEPRQYDVVVVHDPEAYAAGPMVKRVIAVGGQKVRLERRLDETRSGSSSPYYTTTVYVDGTPVRSDFIYQSGSDDVRIDFAGEDFDILAVDLNENKFYIFEYVVPEGEIFVLGDHRNNSTDSREFGSLSEETVLGKVLLRIYPFPDFGTIE